jgi:hypothetical protein
MWHSQTRYGSTIKTAIDFLMTLDPGQEDPRPAFPLVAAAMAIYGDDEKESYRKFLEAGDEEEEKSTSRKKNSSYKSKSWWFYNQPNAFRFSRHAERRDILVYTPAEQLIYGLNHPWGHVESGPSKLSTISKGASNFKFNKGNSRTLQSMFDQETPTLQDERKNEFPDSPLMDEYSYMFSHKPQVLHPDRPGPFSASDVVELDVGIYVFWEQIRHLYEQSWTRRSTKRAW